MVMTAVNFARESPFGVVIVGAPTTTVTAGAHDTTAAGVTPRHVQFGT